MTVQEPATFEDIEVTEHIREDDLLWDVKRSRWLTVDTLDEDGVWFDDGTLTFARWDDLRPLLWSKHNRSQWWYSP